MTAPTPQSFLLVDDDERFRGRLAQALEERGFVVHVAADHPGAMAVARTTPLDRAIVDLRMPGPTGLAVIAGLRELAPAIEIVVLTGYGSIATAVEAIRLGAVEYLTKPCTTDRILGAFAEAGDGPDPAEIETPSLAKVEREHIERVLHDCNGNVSKAARVLGMHRRTLQYKLAKFPVRR